MNMSCSLCWKHFIVTTRQGMIFQIMISPVAVNPQIKLLLVSVVLFNNFWKWRNDRRSERNLCNCVKKPEKKRKKKKKIQDFNGVWTRDLAITGAMLYQLSYEATDVGSRSIVGWIVEWDWVSSEELWRSTKVLRPRRITPSSIAIILQMIWKPNSIIIGLLFIQNNS